VTVSLAKCIYNPGVSICVVLWKCCPTAHEVGIQLPLWRSGRASTWPHCHNLWSCVQFSFESLPLLPCNKWYGSWHHAQYPGGVIELCMRHLLIHLIHEEKLFSVVTLNACIASMNYGPSEVRNKPTEIVPASLSSDGHLKQSGMWSNNVKLFRTETVLKCNIVKFLATATQMWCLGHFLPLWGLYLLGQLPDALDHHGLCLCPGHICWQGWLCSNVGGRLLDGLQGPLSWETSYSQDASRYIYHRGWNSMYRSFVNTIFCHPYLCS